MKSATFLSVAFVVVLGLATTTPAAEPAKSTNEDRLRANLRDLTLQLRTAQADLAAAQAAQSSAVEEKRTLNDKFESFRKQTLADRADTDKRLASLHAQLVEQKDAAAKLEQALAQARAENEKLAVALKDAETKGARLATENTELARRAADLQAKNLQLFLTGNEVLTRYREFSLGKALRSKEPFIGATRTKLENLVQDYRDRLLDSRAKP